MDEFLKYFIIAQLLLNVSLFVKTMILQNKIDDIECDVYSNNNSMIFIERLLELKKES